MNNPAKPLSSAPSVAPAVGSDTPVPRPGADAGAEAEGAAQVAMSPADAQLVGQADYVGGAAMAGLAAGAAAGAVVGGPVGALVGGTVGAVAGILGGETAQGGSNAASPDGAKRLPTEENEPQHGKFDDPAL